MKDNLRQHVATLIKTARSKSGLTQTELSEALGLSSGQFVSNVERGVSSFPIKHANKIARLLRVPMNDILTAKAEDQMNILRRKARAGAQKTRQTTTA